MSYDRSGMAVIDAELLMQELRSGRDVVIVDVRSKAEFLGGHIPGSRHLPMHELIARTCELESHRSEVIVLVSGEGLRARIAAAGLRLAGYDEVTVLDGGLRAWRELGFPIEPTRGSERSPAH